MLDVIFEIADRLDLWHYAAVGLTALWGWTWRKLVKDPQRREQLKEIAKASWNIVELLGGINGWDAEVKRNKFVQEVLDAMRNAAAQGRLTGGATLKPAELELLHTIARKMSARDKLERANGSARKPPPDTLTPDWVNTLRTLYLKP